MQESFIDTNLSATAWKSNKHADLRQLGRLRQIGSLGADARSDTGVLREVVSSWTKTRNELVSPMNEVFTHSRQTSRDSSTGAN